MNYDWKEIRKDYELHNLSYKKLSRIHGPHPKTIAYHAKREKWVKGGLIEDVASKTREYLVKSGAEINREYDSYYEEITGQIASSIKDEKLTATDASFHVGSLKAIRQERLEIRGELTPIQQVKYDLDLEKFEHKRYVDEESLKIKRRGKRPEGSGGDSDAEFID